jgi:hypothetical protein
LPEEARVVSCYDAGRDGFWLHRFLVSQGVEHYVVDSASIEVNRRYHRAKTDRLDVHKLLTMLLRHAAGEKQVWSVVRVPSVVDADRRQRVVGGQHRVVFGTLETVKQFLVACGWKINTAFIERLNLDIRQRVAAIGRRVNTLCHGEDGLPHQLAVFHTYHNFVLPHTSLRQLLQVPASTNGGGSAKVWQPCTPALAAGVTDHVWTLKAVLLFRVPPWAQPHVV